MRAAAYPFVYAICCHIFPHDLDGTCLACSRGGTGYVTETSALFLEQDRRMSDADKRAVHVLLARQGHFVLCAVVIWPSGTFVHRYHTTQMYTGYTNGRLLSCCIDHSMGRDVAPPSRGASVASDLSHRLPVPSLEAAPFVCTFCPTTLFMCVRIDALGYCLFPVVGFCVGLALSPRLPVPSATAPHGLGPHRHRYL